MAAEIRIPALGESVNEATIVRWLKADGEHVEADEVVLELETEKAAMELQAETSGRLRIAVPAGARVQPGALVGQITDEAPAERAEPVAAPAASRKMTERTEPQPPAPSPRAAPATRAEPATGAERATGEPVRADEPSRPPQPEPARSVEPPRTPPQPRVDPPRTTPPQPRVEPPRTTPPPHDGDGASTPARDDSVEREPMTALRRTIAARLVEAQRTAAILTTFNEIDLGELQALRARHRERFKARHGVDLGLMSLFARAVLHGLREVPILNARIEGSDIVKPRHVHLGIAVNTPRGLVVPVVRHADGQSLAALETAIADVAQRAREGKLAPDDLAGGTFTITNGGVFGSLLSTPILNPPQSGILGMHKIEARPVARDGQVVIRPMMYVALSYDHRLVDGAQAVTFLVRVKEALEDPARMVLEV